MKVCEYITLALVAWTTSALAYTESPAGRFTTDGSQADVQSAIDAATDGDIVVIPSGTNSWASGVTITGKYITVRGAGAGFARGSSTTSLAIGTGSKTFTVQEGLGFTASDVIRATYKADADYYMEGTVTSYSGTSLEISVTATNGGGTLAAWAFRQEGSSIVTHDAGTAVLFAITTDADGSTTIEDLHVRDGTGTGKLFSVGGSGDPVVFQRVQFETLDNTGVTFSQNAGLVSACDFRSEKDWAGTANTTHFLDGPFISQSSWASLSTMGSADTGGDSNIYVEDSWLFGAFTQAVDMDGGSRWVWRYNYFDHAGLTTHGMDSGVYGLRHVEIYGNTWIFHNLGSDTAPIDYWFYQRGGTGLIYNNVMTDILSGEYGNKSEWKMQCQNLAWSAGPYGCWSDDTAQIDYPAPRQVGQGYVDGSGTTDGSGRYLGDYEPMYAWGNTGGGNYDTGNVEDFPNTGCVNPDSASDYIQANRDFFPQDDTYDGSAGTGSGLLSARPTSPALTGTGYWATDTDTLYVWDGAQWTTHYQPYTYPHPLTVAISGSYPDSLDPQGRPWKLWMGVP